MGINTSGQVTGYSFIAGDGPQQAFLYSNGKMQNLGSFTGIIGGTASEAYGINDSAQMTGYSLTSATNPHAFLYSNGTMQDIGTLRGPNGSTSFGFSINAGGQVTGESIATDNTYHAFLYTNGAMRDLGTLGGSNSSGSAINMFGQVAGYSQLAGNMYEHAFLYSNGTMQDLGSLGASRSHGMGINDAGQVTGESITSDYLDHAFLYSDGVMQDLNSIAAIGTAASLYTLITGQAINNAGQIVVNGVAKATGQRVALLLTPAAGAAPSDLVASAGNAQVKLSWMGSDGAISYNVYEGTNPDGESPTPALTGITGTNSMVTGLTNGTTYYFKVAAVGSGGTSAPSNEAKAIPFVLPGRVASLVAQPGQLEALLRWTVATNASSYVVLRSTVPEAEKPVAEGVTTTRYTAPRLDAGTTYYFKVAGMNGSGIGPTSAEVSVTPN